MTNKIEICATGAEFLTSGVRYIVPLYRELLLNASKEILITVYSFGSFDKQVKETLKSKIKEGLRVIFIVNRYSSQDYLPLFITEMNSDFSNLEVYDFSSLQDTIDLHAKILGVDHNKVIIGSSNLSRRGQISNYEMGLNLEGDIASQIIDSCYSLINSDKVKKIE